MSEITREQMIEWCEVQERYQRANQSRHLAYDGWQAKLCADSAAMYGAIAARLAEPSAEDVIANDLIAWAEARHPNCDIYLDDLRASVVGLPQNRRCELRIYTDRAVVRFAAPTLPELAEKVRKQDA